MGKLHGRSGGLLSNLNLFVEIGKAARHLRLGATISFHGKERDVSDYLFVSPTSLTRQISG